MLVKLLFFRGCTFTHSITVAHRRFLGELMSLQAPVAYICFSLTIRKTKLIFLGIPLYN